MSISIIVKIVHYVFDGNLEGFIKFFFGKRVFIIHQLHPIQFVMKVFEVLGR